MIEIVDVDNTMMCSRHKKFGSSSDKGGLTRISAILGLVKDVATTSLLNKPNIMVT